MTNEEKRLINTMYDKKGNLTPLGKKVLEHRIKDNSYAVTLDHLEIYKDQLNKIKQIRKGIL